MFSLSSSCLRLPRFPLRPSPCRRFSRHIRHGRQVFASVDAIAEAPTEKKKGNARVVLKKGKAHLFRHGSPIVYSGAIDRVVGRPQPQTGDVVVVEDGAEQAVGWGVFNPASMYRVRIMQTAEEMKREPECWLNLQQLVVARIQEAVALRRSLGLPSAGKTDVFRLINSEGDRLSGIIADVLGSHVVVASSAAWAERYKSEISAAVLKEAPFCSTLIWRPSRDMLREEGIELEESNGSSIANEDDSNDIREVEVLENGIRYWAALDGQKTGFYADQRESRNFLAELCRGKTVLDLCCYSGGFAISSARAGARDVTGVDSSRPAVQLATRNAALNGVDPAACRFVQADISDFMREANSSGRSWDVVVLDPPKLAPNRKVLQRAAVRYRRLNAQAMALVAPGGLLMTCSCSGAVAQAGLLPNIVQEAAALSKRRIRLVRKAQAGPDHPLDLGYPEGEYLSNLLLHVL